MTPKRLQDHPIHLGLGATAVAEPAYRPEMRWYEDYAARHAADGADGRLVSQHRFTGRWDHWEMHPEGAEVVLCLDGRLTLHQERPDGKRAAVVLGPGEYAINEAGVWHTAETEAGVTATALFITAGRNTRHRPV